MRNYTMETRVKLKVNVHSDVLIYKIYKYCKLKAKKTSGLVSNILLLIAIAGSIDDSVSHAFADDNCERYRLVHIIATLFSSLQIYPSYYSDEQRPSRFFGRNRHGGKI